MLAAVDFKKKKLNLEFRNIFFFIQNHITSFMTNIIRQRNRIRILNIFIFIQLPLFCSKKK